MSKILLTINNNNYNKQVDGYILGVKNFSKGFDVYFDASSIKKVAGSNKEKEIYVSFNRLIFNDEIIKVKKILLELDKFKLNGIFFADIALLNIKDELNLKTPFILSEDHLVTNYQTINWYKEKGCYGALLSNEITMDDVIEIRKNTSIKIYKNIYGLLHISTSKRKLITNYYKFKNMEFNNRVHFMKERKSPNEHYIVEDSLGTNIYYSTIFALKNKTIEKLNNNDIDYFIINSYLIHEDKINELFNYYKTNKELSYNTTEGFSNKKTIYKVKNE